MRRFRSCKFGVFEANLPAHELRKHGVRVRLSGQPFALLSMLLERPGEIVTREEMRLRLWSTDTIVDFEHSLNSAIKKLRAALGDSPENSRYIETIPKVGYRFIAPVEESESATTLPQSTAEEGKRGGLVEQIANQQLRRWLAVVGACAITLAFVMVYRNWSRPTARPPGSEGRVMIAVLPFENLTGDAGQDYFSDGLTDEMIAQLGRVDPQKLAVIARSSVVRYKRETAGLDAIRRELGVQYVLEGTVRRDSERVRVTAELIQLKDQTHVWSREYDRSLDKLLVLQSEIAQQIASEFRLTFAPGNKNGGSEALSPETYQAYDLYLKGRYFWNKRNTQGFERALECFGQSIAKDPNYARSYAGLADTYSLMTSYYITPVEAVRAKAKEAAQRATALDDTLAEGHTSLGVIAQIYDWDWATAEKEYRRAIELDPNYATAHHWYAEELALVGRFDEALAEIERARQLDPLSLIIGADRGVIFYEARQYDKAIEQLRAVLDMDPTFGRARMLENVYIQKQMYAEALSESDEWLHSAENPWRWAMRGYLYGKLNQRANALDCLREMRERYPNHPAELLLSSFPYIGLNDKENALRLLERAYANHSISAAVGVEPLYDPLRREPRFHAILAKMHFPPNVVPPGTTAHK
jgi:TolB-like protein/DNA-binding winged helix-turn-helix (wHTH) protein